MKGNKMERNKAVAGLLFSLPALFGLVIFFLIPLAQSLQMAFSDVFIDKNGFEYQFNGIKNYLYAFLEHPTFNQQMVSSILNMVTDVPVIVMFGFFAANLINQKFKGRNFVRVIFFLPIVLSSSAMMMIDTGDVLQQTMRDFTYRSVDGGTAFLQSFKLSEFMLQFGISNDLIQFLTAAVDKVYRIISLSGVQILIILAALQSVSPSLYEAAHVEGASGWEKFWIVTFPMISSSLLLTIVYSIIDSFIAYDNPIIRLTKTEMFKDLRYGMASAMAWIYFVIIAIILGLVIWIGSRLVFHYDE